MSKHHVAMAAQGYTTELHNCGNCTHRQFDMEAPLWIRKGGYSAEYIERNKAETKQRCGIGGFAVKKAATCARWAPKA